MGKDRLAKRVVKSLLPIVAPLCFLWALQTNGLSALFPSSMIGTAVRLIGCFVTIPSMEYFARYNHQYLWHSKYLWWLHGSHHHQYPKIGSTPTFDHGNKYVSPVIELNDIFPVVFGAIACYCIYNGNIPPHSFASEALAGMAIGATVWGASYFFGHDLVAHERGGKAFAKAFKSRVPYLKRCAEVHFQYHHKLTKSANDPYGPPYGFWLGPQEVKAMLRNKAPDPMARGLVWTLRSIVLLSVVSIVTKVI